MNWRVLSATVFSVVLIVGAYELAQGLGSPPVAQASTETALLQAIATKDSNGDGLPDWEKSLYGIPVNATTTDYFHLGMTDGEAVAKGLIVPKAVADIAAPAAATGTPSVSTLDPALPPPPAANTLTDAFAKDFITQYITAKEQNNGQPLTSEQTHAIAMSVLTDLAQSVSRAPNFKATSDLTLSDDSHTSFISYAAAAQTVLMTRGSGATTSEISYLADAVEHGNTHALTYIAGISKDYRIAAVGLSKLPVPPSLASADLTIINALARLSEITQDFTKVSSDPLTAMLALQQYPSAIQALGQAFISVHDTYQSAGVTLSPGELGAAFVNLVPDIAASQAKSATP